MRLWILPLIAAAVAWAGLSQAQSVVVDATKTYQTIDGFGGFGPKKVWWDTAPFYDTTYLNQILDDLGSTIIRTQLYWDFEPNNDDADPNHINWDGFRFGPDSDNGKQFAFIKDLKARGLNKFIASVWTPPIWMKQNPDNGLAPFCNGQCGGKLNPSDREEFAEYLVAYVLKLKEETGMDLYGISIENEPLFANPFESCVYSETDYAALLKVVGKRFKDEGLTTKLFGPEHMGSFDWNSGLFSALLDDPEALQYLGVYAVHSYVGGVSADYGNADGWTKMFDRVHAKNLPLWMTETSDYEKQGWDKAFNMAKGLHLALRFGKISGWVYWYYSGDVVDNDTPSPLFYAFKNYYRYIRPGYVQVDSQSSDPEVLVTAFRKDDAFTAVLIHNGNADKNVSIQIQGMNAPASFDVYRTTSQGFTSVGPSAGPFSLPGQSITTVVAGLSADPPVGGTGGSPGAAGSNGSGGSAGAPGSGGTRDAGTAGNPAGHAGSAGTAGASSNGTWNGANLTSNDDSGCACSSNVAGTQRSGWLAVIAAFAFAMRQRRRPE